MCQSLPESQSSEQIDPGDFNRSLNLHDIEITSCKITPQNLAALLKLVERGDISGKIAKTVFAEMLRWRQDAETIVKEKGLLQISVDMKELSLL